MFQRKKIGLPILHMIHMPWFKIQSGGGLSLLELPLRITQPFCIFATMEEVKCPKFKIYLGSSHLLDLYIGPFREVQHFSFNVAISTMR
jgi:hypothetical protein